MRLIQKIIYEKSLQESFSLEAFFSATERGFTRSCSAAPFSFLQLLMNARSKKSDTTFLALEGSSRFFATCLG